jgi:hypothetical protein
MTVTDKTIASALDTALDHARRGIGTFPLRIGGKEPAIASPHPEGSEERKYCKRECGLDGHGLYDATTDEAKLRVWFGPDGIYRNHNVGARVPAGVGVVDVDVQHDGHLTYIEICDDLGDEWAKRAPCQITGNGGAHLWFREDGVPVEVKQKIGIDVKRDGTGYVVAAPSLHPNGNRYKWTRPLPDDLSELPPLPDDVRAWLAPEPKNDPGPLRAYGGGPDDLGEAVEREWTWDTLLSSHGWRRVKGDGIGDGSAWRHPNAESSQSATIRHETLFNYSETSGLPVTKPKEPDGITLVHAVALLEYGGDTKDHYKRLADDLRSRGVLAKSSDRFGDIRDVMDGAEDRVGGEGESGGAEDEVARANLGAAESWHRINLRAALAGAIERMMPSVLEREDKLACFYAGRLNGVHGDSGTGKSMVLAVAAAQEIRAGHHVIWVDLEDPDPATLIERERLFGLSDDAIAEYLHYYAPREEFTDAGVVELVRESTEYAVSLLIIDSLGEAFGLNAINEDRDAEVGPFLRRFMRPLADAGPAVVMVDHSTKANDNPLHPSGSKRKRAAIQGASYLIEATKPLTREHGGTLRLTCAKDRHGNYRKGATVATIDMHVYPDGGVSVKVWAPTSASEDSPDAKLMTVARAAVRAAKDADRPLSQRELLELMAVRGRESLKRAAIETAISKGGIRVEPGPRNALLHHYVKDLAEGSS